MRRGRVSRCSSYQPELSAITSKPLHSSLGWMTTRTVTYIDGCVLDDPRRGLTRPWVMTATGSSGPLTSIKRRRLRRARARLYAIYEAPTWSECARRSAAYSKEYATIDVSSRAPPTHLQPAYVSSWTTVFSREPIPRISTTSSSPGVR